jgi:hypothetical protein
MRKATAWAIVLASFAAIPSVHADTSNKKTKITFSAPFQIPAPSSSDKVLTLPPGTYVFRLLDSPSDRHIVQVTNPRGDKVYSSILAIPDYRVNASSRTTMYFSERRAPGAPIPLKSWFYPGDNYGQRFVYPKAQAIQVAAVTNQPVPSHTLEVVEESRVAQAPVAVQTPAKQEVAYSPAVFEKNDATDTAGEDGEAVKAAPAAPLPKTASPIYLMGLMGLILLALSVLARRSAAHLQ